MRNAQIRGRNLLRPEKLTDARLPLRVARAKPPLHQNIGPLFASLARSWSGGRPTVTEAIEYKAASNVVARPAPFPLLSDQRHEPDGRYDRGCGRSVGVFC